mgnify:CR=1 FL=1
MNKAFTREPEGDNDSDDEGEGAALPPLPAGARNYLTPQGYRRLREELMTLLDDERPKIVEIVSWAAKNGDRSENGDYLYGRLHKITGGWRRDVKDYSVNQGGAIHMIDLMLWTTGQRPETVSAVGNRICSGDSGFQYNDFCSSTLTFPGGMVGRITANYGCVHRHQHVMRVFGTEGTFIYDDAGARLHESRDPLTRPASIDASPLPAGKGDLIPGFVASVLSGSDFSFETQSIFDGISVAIACDRAAASGLPEKVEYV